MNIIDLSLFIIVLSPSPITLGLLNYGTSIHHIFFPSLFFKLIPHVQVLNMLCCWVEDPNSEAFKLHLPRLYDYLWIAEDGMKMQV